MSEPYTVLSFTLTFPTINLHRVPSTYYIHQGERCERVDEKIVARRGPPTLDNYYPPRVFAEIFYSDMSRRPSKINNEVKHCHRGSSTTINATN